MNKRYVLITAARNEEAYIEKTLCAVISQTILPHKWVIVSNGSTDGTDQIIHNYLKEHPFIHLIRIPGDSQRNFGSQVRAIKVGYEHLRNTEYEFVGNVDADVAFDENYYEDLLQRFQQNPKLGLAGGFFWENYDGTFKPNPFNSVICVAHAVQLFRRECYEAIGGYLTLKFGGSDWVAEVMARMKGWHVESFPDLRVFHHRPVGTADGQILRGAFHQGLMDHSVGSHPIFEVLKCLGRLRTKPYFVGTFFRMAGFLWGYCRREERIVSKRFVEYIRREQMQRVYLLLLNIRKHKSI